MDKRQRHEILWKTSEYILLKSHGARY